jgi:uncharacterized protein YkwD
MLVLLMLTAALAATQPFELTPPPRLHVEQHAERSKQASALATEPLSRSDVARAYQQHYLAQATVAHGWNGHVGSCVPGSTSSAYREAVIGRVNFFRALAGLPGISETTSSETRNNNQAAALIMSANAALSHNPPSSWTCYSSGGSSGAQSSNLALGRAGPEAIDLYIDDPGSFNTAAGHRRWILFPPRITMASGDIPSGTRSNALWVFGASGTRPPTADGVAWPPRGFVPYQVLPTMSDRWSLSYPGANFSDAVVSMSRNGQAISVSYDSRAQNGYGDNTLVWRPATGPSGVVYGAGGIDRTYAVQVSGIGGNGVPATISYTVTVIDGNEPVAEPALLADGFED